MSKKKMIVLASHEPTMDPRVDWVARFAARKFHVAVIGLENPARPAPPFQFEDGYAIMRTPLAGKSLWLLFFYIRLFFKLQNRRWYSAATELAWKVMAGVVVAPILLALASLFLFGKLLNAVRLGRRILKPVLSAERYEKLRLFWAEAPGRAVRSVYAWALAFFSPRFPGIASKLREIANFLVRVQEFAWYVGHVTRTTHSLVEVIAKDRVNADLIYCNDLDTLVAGVLLKRYLNCPLVYDAHEFWAFMWPQFQWWEQRFWVFLERLLAPATDAAFTVNHLLGREMEARIGIPYRSLPNCEPTPVEVAEWHPRFLACVPVEKSSLKAEMDPCAAGRMRFFYQGNFRYGGGLEEIIREWVHVDSTRAVLLLRGPDSPVKSQCIRLAADLGLLDSAVFFLNPVLERDLVEGARHADVGLVPYLPICLNSRFACPNKTSQYMQAGLAILTNKLDYVAEIVSEFQCGLMYDSSRPETIVAAVNRFLNAPDLLVQCKRSAKAKATELFNWEVQSRELFKTCEDLARAC